MTIQGSHNPGFLIRARALSPAPPPCPKRGPSESQSMEEIMEWKKMERGTLNLYKKSQVHPPMAHIWKDRTGEALRTQLWCKPPVSS